MDPSDMPVADPGGYTEPPETYPSDQCPEIYYNSAYVHGKVLLDQQTLTVHWSKRMAAGWEDTGDPYGSAEPPPSQEDLNSRFKVCPKPTGNAVNEAAKGAIDTLRADAAALNALNHLPAGAKAQFQLEAEGASGDCPSECPRKLVGLSGWELHPTTGVYTEETFDFKPIDSNDDGYVDAWSVDMTIKLWYVYVATIYFWVECKA
ncbi:MAG: hypothetical protein KDB68_15705 [Planctomycetes bacterium]|nr:hypothetical protein [Planctomycetota bacterium]